MLFEQTTLIGCSKLSIPFEGGAEPPALQDAAATRQTPFALPLRPQRTVLGETRQDASERGADPQRGCALAAPCRRVHALMGHTTIGS